MATGRERRKATRWEREEDVYCYVESTRCDAQSRNLSAGGMLLESAADIPIGELVALVFRAQVAEAKLPVFLTGRVVRVQEKPVKSYGLRWERAVFPGEAAALAVFLRDTLGIDSARVARRPVGPNKRMQAVYVFDTPTPLPGEAPPAGPLPDAKPAKQSFDGPGPLSRIVSRGNRSPTLTEAVIHLGDQRLTARVSYLDHKGMFVETSLVPVSKDLSLTVVLRIATNDGDMPVTCQCRTWAIDRGEATRNPGINLAISSYDEGENSGILRRYVRWLQFHSLAAG